MNADDAKIIGIGAAVIAQPQPEQRSPQPGEFVNIEDGAVTARSPAGTAIGVLCGAVLGYALVEAALQAHRFYQDLRATPAGEPAIERAIPCPGPGLNERTYVVLSNAQGHIRIDTCVTTHILGS